MNYADDKVKQMLFQKSKGYNSKISDLILPVFKLITDFIHVHLIYELLDPNFMSYSYDRV